MRRDFCLFCVGLLLPAAAAAAETVTFHKTPAQPGDISRQSIDCDLDLEMSIQQGGQVVQSQRQGILRQQVRQLTVLAADTRAATRAEVRYDRSTVALRAADATADDHAGGDRQDLSGRPGRGPAVRDLPGRPNAAGRGTGDRDDEHGDVRAAQSDCPVFRRQTDGGRPDRRIARQTGPRTARFLRIGRQHLPVSAQADRDPRWTAAAQPFSRSP